MEYNNTIYIIPARGGKANRFSKEILYGKNVGVRPDFRQKESPCGKGAFAAGVVR